MLLCSGSVSLCFPSGLSFAAPPFPSSPQYTPTIPSFLFTNHPTNGTHTNQTPAAELIDVVLFAAGARGVPQETLSGMLVSLGR